MPRACGSSSARCRRTCAAGSTAWRRWFARRSQDPLDGSLFVFRSRGADRLKILQWEKDGFCLWYKRLEEGTFRFPATQAGAAGVEIKASEMAMLLEGIDLKSLKRSPRLKLKNN